MVDEASRARPEPLKATRPEIKRMHIDRRRGAATVRGSCGSHGSYGDSALFVSPFSRQNSHPMGLLSPTRKNATDGRVWGPRSNDCGKSPHPRPFSPREKGSGREWQPLA